MFIHLDDNYEPLEIWLYRWEEVKSRAKDHKVRKQHRSYLFMVKPEQDRKFLLYSKAR
jgi:hypothetical protein